MSTVAASGARVPGAVRCSHRGIRLGASDAIQPVGRDVLCGQCLGKAAEDLDLSFGERFDDRCLAGVGHTSVSRPEGI